MIAPLEFGRNELFWLLVIASFLLGVRRWRPIRFSLRSFLIFCTLISVVCGMWARRPPRYSHLERWNIDGFSVDVSWMSWKPGRDHFGRLVAYPSVLFYSLGADGTWIAAKNKRLGVNGRNEFADRSDCKFWICCVTPSGLNVRPIDAECPLEALKDREMFQKSEFWNKHLRVILIEESRRFDRWWFDKYGTKSLDSRFTPPETWDQWFAERAAAGNRIKKGDK